MSNLLVKLHAPVDGRILHITPASSTTTSLALGSACRAPQATARCFWCSSPDAATWMRNPSPRPLSGTGVALDDAPFSVYLPPRTAFSVKASTHLELRVCSAPATGKYPPRLIRADEVGKISRGNGINTRYVRDILPETTAAESLLVVESVTPGGHWSSYPLHKHGTDDRPRESALEETYYHRLLRPSQGYASSGSTRTPAAWTRRWRFMTRTSPWSPGATTRLPRRTASTSTIPTSWPSGGLPGGSTTSPRTRSLLLDSASAHRNERRPRVPPRGSRGSLQPRRS